MGFFIIHDFAEIDSIKSNLWRRDSDSINKLSPLFIFKIQ